MIATIEWPTLLTLGLLVALALVLGFLLAHHDPGVRRTRYGVFVQRDRFDEPSGPELEDDPAEADTRIWRRDEE